MATALSSIADNSSKRSLKVSRRGTRVVNASEANTHTLIFHDLPHLALRLAHSYCPRMQGPLSPHSRSRVIVACAFRVCVCELRRREWACRRAVDCLAYSRSLSPPMCWVQRIHTVFFYYLCIKLTLFTMLPLFGIYREFGVCVRGQAVELNSQDQLLGYVM